MDVLTEWEDDVRRYDCHIYTLKDIAEPRRAKNLLKLSTNCQCTNPHVNLCSPTGLLGVC